ncbi:hypothetical protein MLD38_034076 [Melastoma candidum]|uniref:Uncharacterized protein n=1 Tax=Melastoma candidum TaxID=119954 RepID=A0ACB9M9D6_9MYRT|nr:hypothetical protein MLD38_034076 [Melastoma candidum]
MGSVAAGPNGHREDVCSLLPVWGRPRKMGSPLLDLVALGRRGCTATGFGDVRRMGALPLWSEALGGQGSAAGPMDIGNDGILVQDQRLFVAAVANFEELEAAAVMSRLGEELPTAT